MSVDLTKWQVYTSSSQTPIRGYSVEKRLVNSINSVGDASCVDNPENCCPISVSGCCTGRNTYPRSLWLKFTNSETLPSSTIVKLDYQQIISCNLYYWGLIPSISISSCYDGSTGYPKIANSILLRLNASNSTSGSPSSAYGTGIFCVDTSYPVSNQTCRIFYPGPICPNISTYCDTYISTLDGSSFHLSTVSGVFLSENLLT